jgi:hypothetical protein
MGYLKFARNQTNAANEMVIPAEGIINIISGSVTELIIQYIGFAPDAATEDLLTLTLQVGATGDAVLTRANIVEKVIAAIKQYGIDGGVAYSTVADMEIEVAAWSTEVIDATP